MTFHRFFAESDPDGVLERGARVEATGSDAEAQGEASTDRGSTGALGLSAADVHHVRDVLRLEAGDDIIVVWRGAAARLRLRDVGDQLRGEWIAAVTSAPLPRVTLVQALAKGERMDVVMRQATEIGVSRIVPFSAARSVVALDERRASARVERWRRIAAEAAKQSQRADVPRVDDLARTVDLPGLLGDAFVVVCWEETSGVPGISESISRANLADDAEVALVVGPEGGLDPDEVGMLKRTGAIVVSLGPTILRTETAGVVAAALALNARGGLGG
jgi:16S rRNA (uracil1498-N3)-methyltransferase